MINKKHESILYRLATLDDAEKIVNLLSAHKNPYGWTKKKYLHYYQDYPYELKFSVVAENDKKEIVGHYGFLQVKITKYTALLGAHAYVREDFRGLEIIKNILNHGIQVAKEKKVDLLCGFANENFTQVLTVLLGWKLAGYLYFDTAESIDFSNSHKLYKFEYDNAWFLWKFKTLKSEYFKVYIKNDVTYHQLLKMHTSHHIVEAKDHGFSKINFWNPAKNSQKKLNDSDWTQPFTIKILNPLVSQDILDIKNWHIDMADSDTFEY